MSFDDLSLPVLTINGYLWDVMKKVEPTLSKTYGNIVPIFPSSDQLAGKQMWESNPYIIYDRVFRNAVSPFYEIKKESIIYSLRGTYIQTLQWGSAIQYILDRQDDAAKDINEWNGTQDQPNQVSFHHLRVYQNSSSTPRTFSTNPYTTVDFIVDAEYHFGNSINDFI